jgi:hypothetical protein
MRTALLLAASLLSLTVACTAPDVVAPNDSGSDLPGNVQRALKPSSGPSLSGVTISPTQYSTTIAEVYSAKSAQELALPTYGGSPVEYELRFSYYGYRDAHVEPTVTVTPPSNQGTYQPGVQSWSNVASMPAIMRGGSSDRIELYICVREYFLFTYVGCHGSGFAIFTAADLGQTKTIDVHVNYPFDHFSNTFYVRLNWTPVDYQPIYVKINEPIIQLTTVDGLPRELTASALDANWRYIPGLPVSWSSSNTAVFTMDPNGFARPVGIGTGWASATMAGMTTSVQVDVTGNTPPLTVHINGSSSTSAGQTNYYDANEEGVGTQPYSYSWTVDGEYIGGGRSIPYTYWSSGQHTIAVQISDSAGRTAQASLDVYVY